MRASGLGLGLGLGLAPAGFGEPVADGFGAEVAAGFDVAAGWAGADEQATSWDEHGGAEQVVRPTTTRHGSSQGCDSSQI